MDVLVEMEPSASCRPRFAGKAGVYTNAPVIGDAGIQGIV